MRTIKFRAWEKTLNEMIQVDNIDFNKQMINTDSAWRVFEEIELMQYTGTSDQNDVEIFEGDIVKRFFAIGRDIYDPVSLGFVDHEVDDEGYFIGVVSYRPSEGFVLNQCRKYDIDYNLISKRSGVKIHAQYAEVIGNIFEHPHLLEVSTDE